MKNTEKTSQQLGVSRFKTLTAKEARKQSLSVAERLEIRVFMDMIKDAIAHGRTYCYFSRHISERQLTLLNALGYKVTNSYDLTLTNSQNYKTKILW